MKSISRKNMALVGLGDWGSNIFVKLYKLGILHTACDSNPKTASDKRKCYPSINYTNFFEEVLENPYIEAVLIATPASTHYKYAKYALLAGKDVFVEKPISLSVKEAEELVKIADDANRILMVGHVLRYHPAIKKLKEIISSGKIGEIQYIYSNRLNIGKFRTEENILWSFAPHDISIILSILEEEPLYVKAFGGAYLNKGIHDTTVTILKFKNGVKSHIFVSWLHPFKDQKLIVVRTKGMIVFNDLSQQKLLFFPHIIKWKGSKIPIAQKADHCEIRFKDAEPLMEELKHFSDCVLNRKKPITDGAEGVKVLKIIELAEKSLLKDE